MHPGGAFRILGLMSDESARVDLGFVELDPAGFELILRRPKHVLRHSCGHMSFLDGLTLPEISSAAFLHRMDGCTAGHALQCGLCRRDFQPCEVFRHDGQTWVHNDGCPQYGNAYAIPLPSPDGNSAEAESNSG